MILRQRKRKAGGRNSSFKPSTRLLLLPIPRTPLRNTNYRQKSMPNLAIFTSRKWKKLTKVKKLRRSDLIPQVNSMVSSWRSSCKSYRRKESSVIGGSLMRDKKMTKSSRQLWHCPRENILKRIKSIWGSIERGCKRPNKSLKKSKEIQGILSGGSRSSRASLQKVARKLLRRNLKTKKT